MARSQASFLVAGAAPLTFPPPLEKTPRGKEEGEEAEDEIEAGCDSPVEEVMVDHASSEAVDHASSEIVNEAAAKPVETEEAAFAADGPTPSED